MHKGKSEATCDWIEKGVSQRAAYPSYQPNYAEAHCYLGAAYVRMDQPRLVLTSVRYAIEVKPDYALACYILGAAYEQMTNRQAAMEAYRQAMR